MMVLLKLSALGGSTGCFRTILPSGTFSNGENQQRCSYNGTLLRQNGNNLGNICGSNFNSATFTWVLQSTANFYSIGKYHKLHQKLKNPQFSGGQPDPELHSHALVSEIS
jgi:hypothetical protein